MLKRTKGKVPEDFKVAVTLLPEPNKTAVQLHIAGKSTSEIREALKLPDDRAVYSLLRGAKRKLDKWLAPPTTKNDKWKRLILGRFKDRNEVDFDAIVGALPEPQKTAAQLRASGKTNEEVIAELKPPPNMRLDNASRLN